MHPRLIAVTGPLRGSVFPLPEDDLTIGRLESNRIVVPDIAVSREHCVIRQEGGRFHLIDLDSRNGSFVNSAQAKEHWLEEGDRVEIGDSQFVFRYGVDEPRPSSGTVELEEGRFVGASTVALRREDAIYLQPDRLLAAGPPTARQVRDLQVLLKISQAISSLGDLGSLAARLLELMLGVIPADYGAILLGEGSAGEFLAVFGLDRVTGTARPIHVSRTLVRRVLEGGAALLSNDVSGLEALSEAMSVVASPISAVLAVPLVAGEKTAGVIYLASSSPLVRFDEGHLQLVSGIAGIAAVALENVGRLERLQSEKQRLEEEIQIQHKMVGTSAPMQEVYRFIELAARQPSTVLITGESGTGKELVARALHANSLRATGPFVAVNCAAVVETLLESELFGHEKGAFTGATAMKKGKLEMADGGTLFLDEIAELAPRLQAKLLRVLQEREFERVGGTRPLKVDIRVIAATNRDLEEELRRKSFRQDLYFRLNVVAVRVPPLRERREDILPLANYFMAKHSREAKRPVPRLSAAAEGCLRRYDWPGNVRELENAIERAVVLNLGDEILPEGLPETLETAETADSGGSYHEALQQAKKAAILKALEQSGGSYTEAAKILGIHVNYLHRVIRALNLKASLRTSAGPPG